MKKLTTILIVSRITSYNVCYTKLLRIFLVEHDMGLVMDICDTVCAISFGKMLAIGTPEAIQTNAVVQEAYLGSAVTEDEDE